MYFLLHSTSDFSTGILVNSDFTSKLTRISSSSSLSPSIFLIKSAVLRNVRPDFPAIGRRIDDKDRASSYVAVPHVLTIGLNGADGLCSLIRPKNLAGLLEPSEGRTEL